MIRATDAVLLPTLLGQMERSGVNIKYGLSGCGRRVKKPGAQLTGNLETLHPVHIQLRIDDSALFPPLHRARRHTVPRRLDVGTRVLLDGTIIGVAVLHRL